MKKIIVLFLIFALAAVTPVYADESRELFDLKSLGIIDGEVLPEDSISRGEFAQIMVRFMCIEEVTEGIDGNSDFADVEIGYEHAKAISLLYRLGFLNGSDNGYFYPEMDISFDEAVKVVTDVLGYRTAAESYGGYPIGYTVEAGKLGLLRNVPSDGGFTMKSLVKLLHNALFIEIFNDIADDNTYYKKHMEGRNVDILKGEGVVTANYRTYLNKALKSIHEDEIEIDNVRYKIGNTDADILLGKSVTFYAEDDDGELTLLSIRETGDNNEIIINESELGKVTDEEIRYFDENDRDVSYGIKNAALIRNGRMVSPFEPSDIKLSRGFIRLIDNNKDGEAEFIFINDYENVRVKAVNNLVIELADSFKIDGSRFYNADKDKNVHVFFETGDGRSMSVNDIESDSILSVMASDDNLLYVFYVNSEQISGTVTQTDNEGIYIDDNFYPVFDADSFSAGVGDKAVLYIDFMGYVADVKVIEKNDRYCYVFDYGYDGDNSLNNVMVKIADAAKLDFQSEANADNLDDKNLIPKIICKNDSIKILETTDNFSVNGIKYKNNHGVLVTGIYTYELDKDGKLKSLDTPVLSGGGEKMCYNANDMVFGKNIFNTPFAIDKDTKVLCVPNETDASDADYLVPLEISNKVANSTFNVCGYDYNTDTKKCKLMVFYEYMNADYVPAVKKNTSSAAIVAEARAVIDEEDNVGIKLTLLTSAGETEYTIYETDNAYGQASRLKKGDLIYFAKTIDSNFGNATTMENICALTEIGFDKTVGLEDRKIYGRVMSADYDEIDTTTANIITKMNINCSGTSVIVNIPQRNVPPVFLVDKSGKVSEAKLSDTVYGDDMLYVMLYEDNVMACVIVKR